MKKGRHRRFEEARKLKQQGPEAFLGTRNDRNGHAERAPKTTTSSPTSPPSTARSTTTTKTTTPELVIAPCGAPPVGSVRPAASSSSSRPPSSWCSAARTQTTRRPPRPPRRCPRRRSAASTTTAPVPAAPDRHARRRRGPTELHPRALPGPRGPGSTSSTGSSTYDRTPADPPAVGAGRHRPDGGPRRAHPLLPARPLRLAAARRGRARCGQRPAHRPGPRQRAWPSSAGTCPRSSRSRRPTAPSIDAVLELPLDGFGLDIESTRLADEAERNAGASSSSRPISGPPCPARCSRRIVLPPVVTEVYGTYWGSFPWAELAPYFDVWQPMGYWTNRTVRLGLARRLHLHGDQHRPAARGAPADADAVVHPVGGIGVLRGPDGAHHARTTSRPCCEAAAERGPSAPASTTSSPSAPRTLAGRWRPPTTSVGLPEAAQSAPRLGDLVDRAAVDDGRRPVSPWSR